VLGGQPHPRRAVDLQDVVRRDGREGEDITLGNGSSVRPKWVRSSATSTSIALSATGSWKARGEVGVGRWSRLRFSGLANGLFVEPTIFYDVDNSARIAREEIFGPVAAVIPFD
jgi:hypothetical protein